MQLKTLVDRALQDPAALHALQAWVEQSRGMYRQPLAPSEPADAGTFDRFINDHSDWKLRVHELNDILRALGSGTPPDDTTDRERVVCVLLGLSDDLKQRGRATLRLGLALRRVDRFFDASEALREAVRFFDDARATTDALKALNWLSDCLYQDKQFDATIAAAADLIAAARAHGLRGYEASGLRDLGLAQAALGRSKRALDALRQALEIRRTISAVDAQEQFVADLAAFLNALGTAARTFGDYDEGVRAFLECVEIHHSDGDDQMRALALSEIGYTYLDTRDFDKAHEYLSEAVSLAEQNGPTANSTRWKVQLGTLARELDPSSPVEPAPQSAVALDPLLADPSPAYLTAETATRALRDKDCSQAIALAQSALAWADAHADHRLQVTCLNVLGQAYGELDRVQDGIAALQRGIQIADGGGGSIAAAFHMRYNLATLFLQSGQAALADDVLMAGVANTEVLLSRAESFASRQQIAAGSLGLYERSAWIASHKDTLANHQYLLATTEGVRARNMAAWAAAEARVETSAITPTAAERVRHDLRALRSVEVELDLRHLTSTLTLERSTALMTETRRLQSEIERVLGSQGAESEGPFKALDDTLTQIVTPGVTLLSLFCIPEGVCPVVVSCVNGQIVSAGRIIEWPRSERVAAIGEWTGAAASLRTRALSRRRRTRLTAAAGEEQSDAAAREACQRLRAVVHDRLLSPLSELIRQFSPDRLVVIPHRELAMLPFWDLLESVTSVKALTMAPSLNLFRICRARVRETAGPAFVIDDVSGTLPLAPTEAQSLRQHRGGSIESIQSVEDLIRRAREGRLLHAAAHGLFDGENPYCSGILAGTSESVTGLLVQYVDIAGTVDRPTFAFSGTPGEHSYRLLTVGECMSRLSLSACRLAVLSSCEVGLADPHGGGELTSLPTSLLVSGAKTVIAAMWPVDDGAATVLMDRFYRRWSGGSGAEPSPAAALAAARQDLRRMDRAEVSASLGANAWLPNDDQLPYAHPLYTDAFQCFGDW